MDAAGTLWSLISELWLAAGWNAVVLAALVFTILLCFGRWITPRYRHLMWLVVAVRLALPMAPASPVSLQHLWRSASEPAVGRAIDVSIGRWEVNDQPHAADPRRSPAHGPSDSIRNSSTWMNCIDLAYVLAAVVWPIGMIAMATATAVAGVRFRRRLSGLHSCDDRRLMQLFDECRRRIGLPRPVALLVVPGLNSPALLGLWRPRVLLPDDVAATFSDDELRHVLLHELAHVLRRDVAVSWLLAALRVVHWCNPVFWFVHSRLVAERELACDAEVLRRLSGSASREYGITLLRIVGRSFVVWGRPATVPGFVLFLGGKASLRRRLRKLPDVLRGEGRGAGVAAMLLVGLLALVGWTDAGDPPREAHTGKIEFQLPAGATWTIGHPAQPPNSPLEARLYVMDDLVQREMQNSSASREAVQAMFVSSLTSSVGAVPVSRSAYVGGDSNSGPRETAEFTWVAPGPEPAHGLLVRATSAEHELIRSLIETWRAHGLIQTVLEVRFIMTPNPGLLAVGSGGKIVSAAAGESLAEDSFRAAFATAANGSALSGEVDVQLRRRVPMFLQTLESGLMRELVQRAQADARTNILFAPKFTIWNGQRGVVVSQAQRPFVTGLDAGKDGVTKPQIEMIAEGESLELHAVADPILQSVRLNCRILRSRITDVETAGIVAGVSGESLAVQIPSVEEQRFSVSANVKCGETLLMSPLCRDEHGRQLYVLVTPAILPE